jgi:hypothetical protein
MSRDRIEVLLSRAVSERSVRPDGRDTVPRIYGVYAVQNPGLRFRYGTHPVRNVELVREYGGVARVALFRDRGGDAKELASLLNAERRIGCGH